MFDPVPDDCLFVLPIDQFDLIGGQQQNQLEIIVDKNRLDDVTWFADRPERKSGVIAAKKFSKFKFWEKSFGTDLPNASLSWFTKNGRSRSIPFEMERPILDRVTGEYFIRGETLSRKLKYQGSFSNASIFIDSSSQNQNESGSSGNASTTPSLGQIAQDSLDGAALGFLLYRSYTAVRAGLQAATLRSKNQILDNTIKDLMNNDGLFNEFQLKMDSFVRDIHQFSVPDLGGSLSEVNFNRLKRFITRDEFANNIFNAYEDKLEIYFDSKFSPANFKKLTEAIRENAREVSRKIYNTIDDLYKNEGTSGVFNYYANTLDITADELLSNKEIFADFSAIAKAERADVAVILRSSMNQIRRTALASGWKPVKTGLEVNQVNEIAPQVSDQLTGSTVLDEQELEGGGLEEFIAESMVEF